MAAEVEATRKRGAAAFLDDPFELLQAKRGRCSPSAAAAAVADLGISMEFDAVEALQSVFPGADPPPPPRPSARLSRSIGKCPGCCNQKLQDYLASDSATTNAGTSSSGVASDVPVMNAPTNSTEWADLIVNEMSSAVDPNDARNRVLRILEMFDKSAANCSTPDEAQKTREEHKILKQMLGALLHQTSILKRAVVIQDNWLKDYQNMVQERSQFMEIVAKYQKQIKELQETNYVLSFHLRQSNQRSGISGHRNPDVF